MVKRSICEQKDLAEIAGVSATTFNDWIKAKKYPRIDKIEILANYFGILKSDLIEDKTEDRRAMNEKNDILSDIIVRLRNDDVFLYAVKKLNGMDAEKLAGILRFLQ